MLIQLLPTTKERINQRQNSAESATGINSCLSKLREEMLFCFGQAFDHTQILKGVIKDIFFIDKTVFVRAFDQEIKDSVIKEIEVNSVLLNQLLDNEPVDDLGFQPNVIAVIPPTHLNILLENIDEYVTKILTEYI